MNKLGGAFERLLDFFRESRAELKKVSWPTKKQVWYSTLIVVALTGVLGIYLGVVDFILSWLLTTIMGSPAL
jgi:preprotein translocase subunit SecE